MKKFLALSLSDVVLIMLINVKMPMIVGILTFFSRINFMLGCVKLGKSFITSGPDILIWINICFAGYRIVKSYAHRVLIWFIAVICNIFKKKYSL